MSTIRVKCVICGHTWDAPLTLDMPMCPIDMGPVTVLGAQMSKSQQKRFAAQGRSEGKSGDSK